MATFELNVKINGVEQSVSTIGALEQALAATNQQLSQIDKGSQEFADLSNQAGKLEDAMKAVSLDAANFNKDLKAVNATSQQLNNTFTSTAETAQQAGGQMNSAIQATTTRATSLRTELRKVIVELQGLEVGSARFQELSLRAGELRDEIADTGAIVGSLAGNVTERLGNALSGVANIGIIGMQGVTGAMQLLGTESEATQEIVQKLQGLLFFTQAITSLGSVPDLIAQIKAGFQSLTVSREVDLAAQEAQVAADVAQTATSTINTSTTQASTVATGVHTAAVEADAIATTEAAVATEGFTLALASNPIGLIAVGLATLVGALLLFNGEQEKATVNVKEQTDAFLDQRETINQQKSAIREITKLQLELNVLSAKTDEERKKAKEQLNETLFKLDTKAAENELNAQKLVYEKRKKDAEEFNKAFVKNVEEFVGYEEKIVNRYKVRQPVYRFYDEEVGKKQLEDLKKNLNAQLNTIKTERDKGIITSEVADLRELQVRNNYYNQLLKKQMEFIKQSNKADDDAAVTRLKNAQAAFAAQSKAYERALERQIKVQQENLKQQAEQEDKDEEERKRKREQAAQRAIEDYKRRYEGITKTIADNLKAAQDIEQKYLDEIRKSKFKSKEEEIAFEQEKELEKLKALGKIRLDDIKLNQKDKKKKQDEILKLETEIGEAETALNNFYNQKRKEAIDEEIKLQQQKAAKIKEINDILAKEITFGDQNIADARETLALRDEQLKLQQADFDARLIQDQILNYRQFLQTRLEAQQEILKVQQQLELEQAQTEVTRRLGNFQDFLQKEFGLEELERQKNYKKQRDLLDEALASNTITQDEYNAKVIKLNEAANNVIYNNQKAGLDKQLKEGLISEEQYSIDLKAIQDKRNDTSKTDTAALYQSNINNLEQAKRTEAEINEKFRQANKTAEEKNAEEVNQIIANRVNEIVAIYNQITNVITGLFSAVLEAQRAQDEAELQSLKETNQAKEKLLTEQYNKDLENLKANLEQGLISQEQYNKAVTLLSEQRTATIDGLNKKLNDETIIKQKEAFEKEKKLKVAQAIISGLAGAAQAFASAFQLGPIAGPIVGAVLAALVASTTAIQVAAIQKTKFDSTGLSSLQPPDAANVNIGSVAQSAVSSTGGFTTFNENVSGTGQQGTTTTPVNENNMQKVYVLESDISAVQQRVRVLENNSTFG